MARYKFEQIAINSTEKKKPVEADRFTYLGLEHLDSNSLQVIRFGSEVAPIGEKLVMHKGDVLFGKRRAYQKKVAIAPFDGIFSAHGMVLRPKENVIDKNFFPFFISSDYFLDAAIKISVGSLSPTINWRDLKELEFELPNLAKQKELAEVLWAMDATKQAYQKLLAATDELVKAHFVEMFERENIDKIELKNIAQDWLKGQPLKKEQLVKNGRSKCIHYGELFTKYNSVISHVDSETNITPVKMSKIGDILFPASDVTPLGLTRCSAIMLDNVILGGDIIVMRPTTELNSEYLSYAIRMQKRQLLNRVTGVLVRHISAKSLQTVKIPFPSKELQEQFAAFVRQSNKAKSELERTLSELTATYKRIIAENLG